eukprot:scaffold53624_cov39-Phaeocystis_antarctica.AAC.3
MRSLPRSYAGSGSPSCSSSSCTSWSQRACIRKCATLSLGVGCRLTMTIWRGEVRAAAAGCCQMNL